MTDYYPTFQEGNYYHIYNRGNDKSRIFFTPRNYNYFLIKFDKYLSSYLETYAYSLLPNHFHLLVRFKELSDSIASSDGITISQQISKQFRRFFISYSQAINKQEVRTGSLFQKNFKRIHITSQKHLIYLIYYIHTNPETHGFIQDFRVYPYSTYSILTNRIPINLMKKEVIDWFGSSTEYIQFHNDIHDLRKINSLIIE